MTFRLVDAGWGAEFESALSIDHSELRIVCPFIKARALDRLLAFRPQNVHVITRYNLDDFARRVSDIAALRTLLDRGASVRGIRNLHAKLYIFGQSRAIVTSANLTHAGLERNPEFGIVTEDPAAIASCLDYFDDLWRSGGADLRIQQVNSWTAMLTDHLASGASTKGSTTLEDFGVDAGLVAPPKIALPAPFTGAEQGFVKFLGRSDNRYPLSRRILEQLESGGCHWALTYPRGKRPRQVKDGDVMFIALFTNEPDIRVFGRAVALKHEPDRDDATPAEIEQREWKERWPHYIRVDNAEFLDGTIANGVSLKELMNTLEADSFASTQENAARGSGNIDPRFAYRRQPAVRLSPQGCVWLSERLQAAFDQHGTMPRNKLKKLDWPDPPSHPVPPRDA